uniref:Cilia- and flagella-associated protein 299 n=1 Tax=Dromaius novaehollandiae TaxID=8790 RepID=A0A8C4JIK2_DRONO
RVGGRMAAAARSPAQRFGTYEEYLESQVTAQDLFYLESEAVARQLVELGFRGSGDVLRREDFEAWVEEAAGVSGPPSQK